MHYSICIPFQQIPGQEDHLKEVEGLNRWVDSERRLSEASGWRFPTIGVAWSQSSSYPFSVCSLSMFDSLIRNSRSRQYWFSELARLAGCQGLDFGYSCIVLQDFVNRLMAAPDHFRNNSIVVVSACACIPYRPVVMNGLALSHVTLDKTIRNFGTLGIATPSNQRQNRIPIDVPDRRLFSHGSHSDVYLLEQRSIFKTSIDDGRFSQGVYTAYLFSESDKLEPYTEGKGSAWSLPHRDSNSLREIATLSGDRQLQISIAPSVHVTVLYPPKRWVGECPSVGGRSFTVPVHLATEKPLSMVSEKFTDLLVASSYRPWLRAACAYSKLAFCDNKSSTVAKPSSPQVLFLPPPDPFIPTLIQSGHPIESNVGATPSIIEQPEYILPRYLFRQAGDFWEYRFDSVDRKKTKKLNLIDGAAYAHLLISNPNKEMTVEELVHEAKNTIQKYRITSNTPDDDVADCDALKAYHEELRELNEQIARAERHQHEGELALLKGEMSTLERNVTQMIYRDKPAKLGNSREGFRKKVYNAIRITLYKHLQKNCKDEAFVVHLTKFLKTGNILVYSPPEGVEWVTN